MKKNVQFDFNIGFYAVGSPCVVGNTINGVVTNVNIGRFETIKYEVSYWSGSSHHAGIFNEFEVKFNNDDCVKTKIGFNKNVD